MQLEYRNTQGLLAIAAALTDDWCAHPHTYCFSADRQIDFQEDWRIRVKLCVLPRPAGLIARNRSFPREAAYSNSEGPIKLSLDNGVLSLSVDIIRNGELNRSLPWALTTETGRLRVWCVSEMRLQTGFRYEVQLLIVFREPANPGLRDRRVWSPPGELASFFESNRRRH